MLLFFIWAGGFICNISRRTRAHPARSKLYVFPTGWGNMELPGYIIRAVIVCLPSFRDGSRRAFVSTCRAYRALTIAMANEIKRLAEDPDAVLLPGPSEDHGPAGLLGLLKLIGPWVGDKRIERPFAFGPQAPRVRRWFRTLAEECGQRDRRVIERHMCSSSEIVNKIWNWEEKDWKPEAWPHAPICLGGNRPIKHG